MTENFGMKLKLKLTRLGQLVEQKLAANKYLWVSDSLVDDLTDFEGCSDAEIELLKQSQKVACLPNIYVDFLKVLGKSPGSLLFKGAYVSYSGLRSAKAEAEHWLYLGSHNLKLPENAFVFYIRVAGVFKFFHTDCVDDDPAVYSYMEEDEAFIKEAEHLSVWFEHEIEERERLIRKGGDHADYGNVFRDKSLR